MENFTVVIFIMTILVVLSAFADKRKVPYTILLVLAGLVIGFIPALPDLAMDPEVVFLIFLPPLLYDAASKTSWHEFRAMIRPIAALAISLIFFTTLAVAVAAHYLIPGFSWPVSFVLGAIVSPPDAVAASAITKGLGLNKKVVTILEGESLLNDASALIAYRFAIISVSTGVFVFWKAGLEFLLVAGAGILTGIVIGYLFAFAHDRIKNNAIVETCLTLLLPFTAYLLAEHFKVSGILAVVSAGLIISWRAPEIFTYQARINTRVVWDTLIYLLNGFVFILIGLQLPSIIKNIGDYPLGNLLADGLWISLATILVRIFWVFAGAYWQKFVRSKKNKDITGNEAANPDTWKNVLIVAWTGTRGIISLASALALPLTLANGADFPKRHSIIFLSFVVIFVTLVVQGLSLPLLIRILKVSPQDNEEEEEKELKLYIANSTLQFIDHEFPMQLDDKIKYDLRKDYELQVKNLSKEIREDKRRKKYNRPLADTPATALLTAQTEVSKFQLELLITLHKEGAFSDAALKKAGFVRDIDNLQLDMRTPINTT